MIWELGQRHLKLGVGSRIMGILNTTPDSFYDGGRYGDVDIALERALEMEAEGADIIDIGGESTRPPIYGEAVPVLEAEECRRVVPVVEALRRHSNVPVSVDTSKAEVARQALEAGADIVNDITALRGDEAMVAVLADTGAPAILMHMRGTPLTTHLNQENVNVLGEIECFLRRRVEFAISSGVDRQRLAIDPGLGFGKSRKANLKIVGNISHFVRMGFPVLVGASRKSFVWKTTGGAPEDALEGSLASAVICALAGVDILRVHDVGPTVRAVRLAEAASQTIH